MEGYLKVLKKKFNHDSFRDKQYNIIKHIIDNKGDICAIMFTGAGKSLCYQYPPVYLNKTAIVVSPLISLMNDQQMKMDELGIPTACLNSTIKDRQIIASDILKNKYRIVYTTPEYISGRTTFIKQLEEKNIVCLFGIDEAHCISSWGCDFRTSYRSLSDIKNIVPNVPILAMTATATEMVQTDIIKSLKLLNPLIIKTTFDRPNLNISIKPKKSLQSDLSILSDNMPTIVYCQTRKNTEIISKLLNNKNIKSGSYHAGMKVEDREKVHNDFSNNKIKCVVATIAFGMGIDKIVRRVVHYGIPKDIESYYQEIGRAGRDGKLADCVLYYSQSDTNINNYLINQIEDQNYRKYKQKLGNKMKEYIFYQGCRRVYILNYFGEEYEKKNCSLCDNCKIKPQENKKDFTKDAKILMGTIIKTNATYGSSMIIDIIRGAKQKKIQEQYKKIKEYGLGSKHSKEWWKILCQLLIIEELICENTIQRGYGCTLGITNKGNKWIRSKNRLELNIPNNLMEVLTEEPKINIPNKTSKTIDVTYNMLNNMSIEEIAKTRHISVNTIENHIIECYKEGKEINFEKIGFNTKKYKKIKKVIGEFDNPRLRDIKQSLPEEYTYLDIKISFAIIESRKSVTT